MTGPIKESHNGIWYYADPGAESVSYKGRKYKLLLWRNHYRGALQVASANRAKGTSIIVRKIAFHRGGINHDVGGKWTIYGYGIYGRK